MYNRSSIFSSTNQRNEIKKRIWSIMIIFILLFCLLVWKITNYMYLKADSLKTMANAQYTIEESYGMQYNLLDCNGKPLLDYTVKYYAIIDPVDYKRFNNSTSKYDLAALIITLRNYNSEYDLEMIKDNGNGEKIRYTIDEATYNKLKDIKDVKGFYIYAANEVNENFKNRYWKIENLLTNAKYINNKGVSVFKNNTSLEMQIYNKTKNNEFNKIRFVKGVDGELAEGKIIKPKNNVNVRLTLDKEIQDKVEGILHEEKNKKYKQIGVVLMDSSTGKIRSMAQKDDNAYNANLGYPSTNGALPGSIFKVIVDEAGLDLNLIDNNKIYKLDPKLFPEDSHQYKDKNKFTIGEALRDSSNNIFAQIGWDVGFQNIYNYAEKQGILGKVLNLEQEDIGKFQVDLLHPMPSDTSLTAIGQNVTITPLEAISIPNTIINNGTYVQPSIIDSYVNDNNEILENITSKTSQVLKRETAEIVKSHMVDVVNNGTGKVASIEGMDIGGKTGTTTYLDKGIPKSDGWFVGFFNINQTNYSMVVFVNDIKMNIQGVADEEAASTAAPIFKEIVNALKAMN